MRGKRRCQSAHAFVGRALAVTMPDRAPRAGFHEPLLLLVALAALGCADLLGAEDWRGAGGGSNASATGTAGGAAGAKTTGSVSSGGSGGNRGNGGRGGEGCASAASGIEPLACDQGKPSAMAVVGGLVYWVNESTGTIQRVPAVGGATELLAEGEGHPCGIAVDGVHVFWRTHEGAVRQLTLGEQDPVSRATGQGDSCAIASDVNAVYWGEPGPSSDTIWRAPLSAGAGEEFVTLTRVRTITATDPIQLFWTAPTAGAIYSADKATGAVTQVATATDGCGIGVDATQVFWTQNTQGQGSVRSALLQGGMQQTVAGSLNAPCPLALDASNVYFADVASPGTVNRVSKSGGAVTPLADGQLSPCSVAIESTSAFWTTCEGGTVMRALLASSIVVGGDPASSR